MITLREVLLKSSGLLCLFLAWLLLLLVSLSVPIAKSIYFLQLSARASSSLLHSHASGSVRFGVWGYCTSAMDVAIAGINRDTAGQCTTQFGYKFDPQVARALHVDAGTNAISTGLSAALSLHVIDCILAFGALCVLAVNRWVFWTGGVRTCYRYSKSWFHAAFGLTSLAALLTIITFVIDVAFVSVVRDNINGEADGTLQVTRGNAVWMILVAAIFLWVLVALLTVEILADRRSRRHELDSITEKSFDSNLMVAPFRGCR